MEETAKKLARQFIELKDAGKINSEIDAFIEGKIMAMTEENNKTKEETDGTNKTKTS